MNVVGKHDEIKQTIKDIIENSKMFILIIKTHDTFLSGTTFYAKLAFLNILHKKIIGK